MCVRIRAGLLLLALVTGRGSAADPLRSGPPVNSKKLPAFNPYHVSGPEAGTRASPIVRAAANPTVLIFAHEASPRFVGLLRQLDEVTARQRDGNLGLYVVFCSDEKGLEQKLKDLAEHEKFRAAVLTIGPPAGPNGYDLSPEADLTVLLYTRRTVQANHAFRKGELADRDIAAVVADLARMLVVKK